jgi:hypothetical protein
VALAQPETSKTWDQGVDVAIFKYSNILYQKIIVMIIANFLIENWGRCYDHNFLRFSVKKMAFFSKTKVMIKILHNLALFPGQKMPKDCDQNLNPSDRFLTASSLRGKREEISRKTVGVGIIGMYRKVGKPYSMLCM